MFHVRVPCGLGCGATGKGGEAHPKQVSTKWFGPVFETRTLD